MNKQTGRIALAVLALSALATSTLPAQAAQQSACTTAASSARNASDAIIATATALPDDAAALMTCIFPLMAEKDFRAAALTAAEGVKNAELSQFIIETASNLLLKSSKLRVVPDTLNAVPDTSASPSS